MVLPTQKLAAKRPRDGSVHEGMENEFYYRYLVWHVRTTQDPACFRFDDFTQSKAILGFPYEP